MKMIKQNFYCLLLLALGLTACQDDTFTDIAISVPTNLDVVAEVANDDTGTVTLTPTADGAAYFEVDYGDGSGTAERIQPGKSGTHVYPEGDYTVSVTAYGLGGQSVETTKELMVRFTPPENLVLNISVDPVQTNVITVAPTADNAMNFEVYFGDVEDEEPNVIGAGETITHTYAASGTYSVRVVAKSASSTTIEAIEEVEVVKPTVSLTLPIDFENPDITYSFAEFGGAALSVVDNPDATGENTSDRVGQLTKTEGAEVWAGGFLQLPDPIDFSRGTDFTMKVWSPKAGAIVRFKVENQDDGNIFFEADDTTTTSNAWEELSFDFSAIDQSQSYHKIVVFMDFGNNGEGSNYFFDDIQLGGGAVLPTLALPVDFENAGLTYPFVNFGGAETSVIDNPDASAANPSAKVANLNKGNGAEVWAGSFLQLEEAIDFMNNDLLLIDVWSPKQDVVVKLKVENSADPNINYEVDLNTTTSNTWETLEYDFSGIDASQEYDRVVVFFDFGNPGDGSDYYFDHIRAVSSTQPAVLALPLDFENADLVYDFISFGNVVTEIVDNPLVNTSNTSARTGQLTKSNGAETWGGAVLELDQEIDFSQGTTFEMKAVSPKPGVTVLLKIENLEDGNIFYEATTTTSVVDDWETLSFDFSGVDQSQSYSKVVVFFDFGVTGDGAVYLFDDITLK